MNMGCNGICKELHLQHVCCFVGNIASFVSQFGNVRLLIKILPSFFGGKSSKIVQKIIFLNIGYTL